MRKLAILALLLSLTGCASSPYGNFAENSTPVINQKLAAETVKQLVRVYPPASTRFNMGIATPDAYGKTLVATLRARGYSVLEFNPEGANEATTTPRPAVATTFPGSAALNLRYIVDSPINTEQSTTSHRVTGSVDGQESAPANNLYRVTVLVGSQSLTRAYITQNSSVYPVGAWARKE